MNDYWHWHRHDNSRRNKALAGLLIVIALLGGFTLGNQFSRKSPLGCNETSVSRPSASVYMKPVIYDQLADADNSSVAYVVIPAVDTDEKGITTTMFVQAFPGSGRVLTNIDKLLFWVDTQNSIRRATQVAENITGVNISRYDIIYTIQANASVIGGPSAGAAITIATIAALQNRTVNNSVMITGSVNHDGTIGPVGAIVEKASASMDSGAQVFLVPLTQSSQVTYKSREYCEKIGWVDFCTTETYPVKVDIEKETGITVREVMDIEDAMEYMLV